MQVGIIDDRELKIAKVM